MSIVTEFKDFIAKGNVMDMAVGIIIGAAFTAIVNSLVKDLINPIIGLFTGGIDFSAMYYNLTDTEYESLAAAQEAGAATLNYGMFFNALIQFFIIAFVVFMLVKMVNKVKKAAEDAARGGPEAPADAPAPPADIQLLTEIRDALKAK